MKFDALPDDVLLPIFEAAIPSTPNIIGLKRSIYQMSITQRLRHLLIPRIYGHAFISSVYNRKQEQTNVLDLSFIRSNLELAIATSNVLSVRVLHIETEYTGLRGECVYGLINALSAYHKYIIGVNELVLWIDYNKLSKLQIPPSDNAPDYATATAKQIAQLLPHIKRVTIREKSNEQSTERFYGELVNAYIGQLETLVSESRLMLPTTQAFDQLTCLKVDVELCGSYNLPRVCPNTIQHLKLENLLPNSTWRVFGFEDVPTSMEAPNLLSLDIKYHDYLPDEDYFDYEAAKQCKMHFPRLKSLKLCIRSVKVPLLDSAVFPQHMDYITIEASPLSTLMLHGIEFPKTKFPSLVVFSGDNAPLQDLFKATESFFERSTECLEARLLIPFTSYIISPGMIQCTMFTILHLRTHVYIDTMLDIVTRMQNLKEFAVSSIIERSYRSYISIPEPSSMRILKPLHTRMKNLSIWANSFDTAGTEIKTIVKYLVLCVPSLTQLYARNMNINELESFRKEYEGLYPHLSTISFER